MRRANRLKTDLPIEIYAGGRRHVVSAGDLSRGGMFVRDLPSLATGTLVRLAMVVDGVRHVTGGRVAHSSPIGVGVAFRAPESELDAQFADAIGGMIRRFATGTGEHPIVDGGSPLTARVQELAESIDLDAQHTVVDGTVLELVPEAAATSAPVELPEPPPYAVLRGTFPLPAVFQMLEQEKMTGRLAVAPDSWIDFADGRIVGAGCATDPGEGLACVLRLLDRRGAMFEFRSRARTASAYDPGVSVTHVLMEHARLTDEKTAPHRAPTAR